MNYIIIGFTLDLIGKLLVSFTAIAVHHRFLNEHKIDRRVFASMKLEQKIGIIGIILIIAGYFLQLPGKIHI